MRAFSILCLAVLVSVGIGAGVVGSLGSTGDSTAVLTAFHHAAGASSEHVSLNILEHIAGVGDETITMVGDQGQVDGGEGANYQLTLGGKTINERLTPSGTYLNLGTPLPGGATWMEITTSGMSKILGVKDVGSLFSSQGDPSEMIGLLAASSPSGISNAGSATIDGTATTEYKATVDLSSIVQHEGASYGQLLAQFRKFFTTGEFPISVWIDGSGLPRQVAYSVPERVTIQGTPLSINVGITLDLSNYGEPVAINPPATSQVFVVPDSELKSLAGILGGASGS